MADQWPPDAPGVNKAFKKAHSATNDNVSPPPVRPMVTKKGVEEMKKELKRTKPAPALTPKGTKEIATTNRELEKRMEKANERLQKAKDQLKIDFDRSR